MRPRDVFAQLARRPSPQPGSAAAPDMCGPRLTAARAVQPPLPSVLPQCVHSRADRCERRGAARYAELAVDVLEVLADGRRRDPQLARDLGGRLAAARPRRTSTSLAVSGGRARSSATINTPRVGASTTSRVPFPSTRRGWSRDGDASHSPIRDGSRPPKPLPNQAARSLCAGGDAYSMTSPLPRTTKPRGSPSSAASTAAWRAARRRRPRACRTSAAACGRSAVAISRSRAVKSRSWLDRRRKPGSTGMWRQSTSP